MVAAVQAPIEWVEHVAGLAAIERGRDALPAETLDAIRAHEVALKGPCTTPIGEGFVSINVPKSLGEEIRARQKRKAALGADPRRTSKRKLYELCGAVG